MNLIPLPFFLAFMVGDIVGRKNNNLKLVSVCQPMTTAMALVTAGLSNFGDHRTPYTIGIVVGLLIAVIADSILVSRTDKSAFIKGMVLFFFTIVTYGITWTKLSGISSPDPIISIVMLIIYCIITVVFLNGRGGVDGKPSHIVTTGVLVYLFAFCLVISRAISTFYGDYFSTSQSILLTIGITLFFMGDCQLGIYHFINKHFPMVQAPPFYFVGQLLIALSCSNF
mgnify:CR=1 FL=1